MQNITTSNQTANDLINRAQRMISAAEGRTLDFSTADEINRTLLAVKISLSEAPVVSLPEDEPDMTDEEWLELESLLSRDHDDSQFWTLGGAR